MSNIISFKNDDKSNFAGKDVNISVKNADIATVKYTTLENLPKREDKSVLIYTTDTQEFFIGQGVGSSIVKINLNNVHSF